jgi:hypothetical protein
VPDGAPAGETTIDVDGDFTLGRPLDFKVTQSSSRSAELDGPSFIYPKNGQTLDYEGAAYLFKVKPVPGASGYLWGFFQGGKMVWENYRNEGKLSGTQYGIQPGTPAHKKFVKGNLEVWVRGLVNGKWTNATIITIDLQPKATSTGPTPTTPEPRSPTTIQEQKVHSRIWSGYAFYNDPKATYSHVKGSWIEPKVNCPLPTVPSLSSVGIWVGISGAKVLAQIGTVTKCSTDSHPQRKPVYEVVPDMSNTEIKNSVKEGDRITAEVAYANGRYDFRLTNHTEGWVCDSKEQSSHCEKLEHFDSKNDTPRPAECIVERPVRPGDVFDIIKWLYPLPNFGQLTFSECTTEGTADGKPVANGNKALRFQIVQGNLSRGTVLSQPSDLCVTSSGALRFSIKWLETGAPYITDTGKTEASGQHRDVDLSNC